MNDIVFSFSYFICGILCSGIGIIYAICIFKDIRSLTPKLPGYKRSQIFFIISCCFRGVGWISQAIIILKVKEKLQLISAITVGLPGYIITISYVLFFYLWSSICVNLISNDSTTGFKKKFKRIFNISIGIIVFFGFILVIFILIQLVHPNSTKYDIFIDYIHLAESIMAVLRDLIICSLVLYETWKIVNMSEKPFFSFKYNESIYCWMLVYIIVALYIRAFSIIVYIVITYDKSNGSTYDYCNTFITAILSEILPCFMILMNRRRSGLLSVYDLIE